VKKLHFLDETNLIKLALYSLLSCLCLTEARGWLEVNWEFHTIAIALFLGWMLSFFIRESHGF